MPVTYVKIPFAYRCGVCQSTDMENVQERELTEWHSLSIYDDNKNLHEEHDDNDGTVVLTCRNGHKSEQTYVGACTCGWNSTNGDGSCETFARSTVVGDLFAGY